MKAKIVVGLGFGDEGKGLTTDHLCSETKDPIVIRHSGGQQAGHCVMTGGKKHVHSNFGAGTLRGVPSYFTEHTSFYLNTMARELEVLREKGIEPKLYIHPLAKVTTPYDVAWNRYTEKRNRHGSCGLGIAATMKRHNETGYKLFAIDLKYPKLFVEKTQRIYQYYRAMSSFDKLYDKIADSEASVFYRLMNTNMFITTDYSLLQEYNLIFEGSQGILLDMDHGIFPNVTYANTTSRNAVELCRRLSIDYEVYYVTRCYQTRHGNGWMSNSSPVDLINTEHEINVTNEWQGNFRIAELDYDLLNHSLAIDRLYSGNSPKHLVVTCLDQRPEFTFDYSKLNQTFLTIYESNSPYTK